MKTPDRDLPASHRLTRRALLRLAGAGAASFVAGLGDTAAAAAGRAAKTAGCVVRPEQTEGPYFLDERLERADIRGEPGEGSATPGVPLRLTFRVSRAEGRACTALAGAVVDVWQCDARGVYSGVRDFAGRFDARGKQFLRGFQRTDADGIARFVTIYPGWYPGRAVHIHFKIRTDPAAQRGETFTSQLYFDDALTDRIHARPPYARQGVRRTRNADDAIFRSGGGDMLVLRPTRDTKTAGTGDAYASHFEIALRLVGSGA